ncbi:hypothetical protein E8E11_006909 [Didymella keratinophila]|nr:hypothetical protein E8E11_006909 [Didymella keratinophila]
MSDETQLVLTNREKEVLAIAWQCFTADPKVDMPRFIAMTGVRTFPAPPAAASYTKRSAETMLSALKKRLREHVQHISADNPTGLAVKGGGRKPATKKHAAKDAKNEDGEEAHKPKKRAKKASKGPELTGEEADKMMGLGGGEEKTVKEEPQDLGFGWCVGDGEVEDEV